MGFLVARERYIDDYLTAQAAQGVDQLVILGAGYDSRALRFETLAQHTRVFEVDHPATQALKVEKVKQIFGGLPEHVQYVALDFNQQSLAEGLLSHGYDPEARTFFLWQGVTYYLDPPAIDATLAFIARQSGPGSTLIFDYIDEALLRAPLDHQEVKGMRRYRGMTGEDLRFGIPVDQVERFLTARGFEQVQNIGSADLKALYFKGKNQSRSVMAGYAIVSAVVSRPRREEVEHEQKHEDRK
jgi:methyltransferase (TIGR00027 family)